MAFPHISISFVFRPSLHLAHFFSFKDRSPNGLKSRVVYLLKCWCCNASYLGQTSRFLHTRIADHLGISVLTGKERITLPQQTFYHITTTLAIPQHQMISPCSLTPPHLSLMNSSLEKVYSFTNSILPSTLNQAQFLFAYSESFYPLRHLWHLITSYFLSNAKFMLINHVIIF